MKYTVTEQVGNATIIKEYEGTPEEIAALLKDDTVVNYGNIRLDADACKRLEDIVNLFDNLRKTSRLGV